MNKITVLAYSTAKATGRIEEFEQELNNVSWHGYNDATVAHMAFTALVFLRNMIMGCSAIPQYSGDDWNRALVRKLLEIEDYITRRGGVC